MDTTQELKEFYDKAILAFNKANYDYAIELFLQLLSQNYDFENSRHLLHLSLNKRFSENPPSIIAKVFKNISSFFIELKADGLRKKNEKLSALNEYEKCLLNYPYNVKVLNKIYEILLEEKLTNSAIKILEEIRELQPKNLINLKTLGDLYLKVGEYNSAKDIFEEILKQDPKDPDAIRGMKNLDALGTIKRDFTV